MPLFPSTTLILELKSPDAMAFAHILLTGSDATVPLRFETVPRPVEALAAADAIQYQTNGGSHAILWGVRNNSGKEISYNDGSPVNGELPIQAGLDVDRAFAVTDASGADFRYRHANARVEAVFLDGHITALAKGHLPEKLLYTDY